MAMFRNVMVYLGLGPDDEYDENYLYDEDNVDFDGLERRTVTQRGNDGVRIVEDDDDFGVGTVRPLRPVPDGVSVTEDRPFGDLGAGSPTGSFAADLRSGSMEHPSAGFSDSVAPVAEVGSTPQPSEPGFFGGANGGSQQRPETDRSNVPTQSAAPDASRQTPGRVNGGDQTQTGGSQSRPQNERASVPMEDFSQSQGVRGAKPRTVIPRSFDDAKNVANEYQAGSPVVMNLREADKETGRRLLDFSSGMVYGLGGGMEKLAANVFLISPDGVEVSDDDRRRLEERGYGH